MSHEGLWEVGSHWGRCRKFRKTTAMIRDTHTWVASGCLGRIISNTKYDTKGKKKRGRGVEFGPRT